MRFMLESGECFEAPESEAHVILENGPWRKFIIDNVEYIINHDNKSIGWFLKKHQTIEPKFKNVETGLRGFYTFFYIDEVYKAPIVHGKNKVMIAILADLMNLHFNIGRDDLNFPELRADYINTLKFTTTQFFQNSRTRGYVPKGLIIDAQRKSGKYFEAYFEDQYLGSFLSIRAAVLSSDQKVIEKYGISRLDLLNSFSSIPKDMRPCYWVDDFTEMLYERYPQFEAFFGKFEPEKEHFLSAVIINHADKSTATPAPNVYKYGRKFQVYFTHKGEPICKRPFDTIEEAMAWRNEQFKRLMTPEEFQQRKAFQEGHVCHKIRRSPAGFGIGTNKSRKSPYYQAYLKRNGKFVLLKGFKDLEEAKIVRDRALLLYDRLKSVHKLNNPLSTYESWLVLCKKHQFDASKLNPIEGRLYDQSSVNGVH